MILVSINRVSQSHCCVFFVNTGNFDRAKDFKLAPDLRRLNLDKLGANHPLFGDRLARASDDVRSRLDEARRVNIEEMRQLQR